MRAALTSKSEYCNRCITTINLARGDMSGKAKVFLTKLLRADPTGHGS